MRCRRRRRARSARRSKGRSRPWSGSTTWTSRVSRRHLGVRARTSTGYRAGDPPAPARGCGHEQLSGYLGWRPGLEPGRPRGHRSRCPGRGARVQSHGTWSRKVEFARLDGLGDNATPFTKIRWCRRVPPTTLSATLTITSVTAGSRSSGSISPKPARSWSVPAQAPPARPSAAGLLVANRSCNRLPHARAGCHPIDHHRGGRLVNVHHRPSTAATTGRRTRRYDRRGSAQRSRKHSGSSGGRLDNA